MNVRIYDVNNNELNCEIKKHIENDFTRFSFTYKGSENVCIRNAVFNTVEHGLSADTEFYAESYNMLSQYYGTIKKPVSMTDYTDSGHYKLPSKDGFFTAYSLFIAYAQVAVIYAFTSANRFVGKINFNEKELILEQDLCGIEIKPDEEIFLEEILIKSGSANELFEIVGNRLSEHHPMPEYKVAPLGWCSWYCFGPECTTNDVVNNMEKALDTFTITKENPFFIQIDDGYQAYMGDFLDIADTFEDFGGLIDLIHKKGCQPALWVAPFIAEADSKLFKEHPEYFVIGEDGTPLCSADCSFGGWRRGPWYMIDGTNPAVLEYLKNLFSTLRKRYGIKYFKLDANVWGALPFGKRYDNTKTYVEAYRNAMNAIIEGAGDGAFILGCNAPMWASIGVVHGMRVGGDVSRDFHNFKTLHDENSHRNWQHAKLWINDPDCIVTINMPGIKQLLGDGTIVQNKSTVSENEFAFHRTAILATGGMILSGDDMVHIPDTQISYIKKIMAVPRIAAVYDDNTRTLGRQKIEGGTIITAFSPTQEGRTTLVKLEANCDVYDFWSGEKLYENVAEFEVKLLAHDGNAFFAKIV